LGEDRLLLQEAKGVPSKVLVARTLERSAVTGD